MGGLLAAVLGGRPALAADLENGEGVFSGNCAACHAGGNNSVVPEKKIKKEALEKYLTGGDNVEAIKYQVTNGKGSMPAFGERLGPDDIDDVANYVFDQATKWSVAFRTGQTHSFSTSRLLSRCGDKLVSLMV